MCLKIENYTEKIKVSYFKLFVLFMTGSLAGYVFEGFFSLIKRGAWESHVVSVWGPFCILYGIGFAACYAGYSFMQNKGKLFQFLMFGIGGCVVELICGAVIDFGIHMRAWNYTKHPFNFRGYVSPDLILLWGAMGLMFVMCIPFIERVFNKIDRKPVRALCGVLTVFMAVNFFITGSALIRWSQRHFNVAAANAYEESIDARYPDDYMENRFIEWRFIKADGTRE